MASPSAPERPGPTHRQDASVEGARRFALTEDWLATVVGLTLVVLMVLGVVTAEWLPW